MVPYIILDSSCRITPTNKYMSKAIDGSLIEGVDAFEIIPRVIVGSYPSNRERLQGKHTDLAKLCNYLCDTYDNSLIVNLVAEKEIYSIDKYNNSSIEILHVFWKDNHAIALCEFVQLIYFIMNFLKNNRNGVFIHCKHGKGRTGTLTCALLMLIEKMNVGEANAFFAKRRTLYKTGVKQKSQIRLLHYWKHLVDNKAPIEFQLKKKQWRLKKIILESNEQDNSKEFIVQCASIEPYSTSKSLDYKDIGKFTLNQEYYSDVILTDDICLKVIYENYLVKTYITCCFNCQMEKLFQETKKTQIGKDLLLRFAFEDLDGVKGTQFKGKQYFRNVCLTFNEI